MSDISITKYRSRKPDNPYIADAETVLIDREKPIADHVWTGYAENEDWRELREEVQAKTIESV